MKPSMIAKLFKSKKTRVSAELQYLNNSISIYDLERRQQEISRGLFR
jgi:hypothetical protein